VATRIRYRRCQLCGRSSTEAGPISARGKCAECADRRMLENLHSLRAHAGEGFERWYDEMHLTFQHRRLPEQA
jgi:hypothetical protein